MIASLVGTAAPLPTGVLSLKLLLLALPPMPVLLLLLIMSRGISAGLYAANADVTEISRTNKLTKEIAILLNKIVRGL
jgi:hypothetical protein